MTLGSSCPFIKTKKQKKYIFSYFYAKKLLSTIGAESEWNINKQMKKKNYYDCVFLESAKKVETVFSSVCLSALL